MRCQECGEEIGQAFGADPEREVVFCPNCGARQQEGATGDGGEGEATDAEPEPSDGGAGKGATVAFGFAFGLFLVLGLVLLPGVLDQWLSLQAVADQDVVTEPFRAVVWGGLVYPAILGAIGGALVGR
jgi:hypothetical protein